MKTFVRPVWAVSALILTMILAGCESPHTARYYRGERSGGRLEPLYDFQVVSASRERRLSTAELEQLEAGVQKFMASQGLLVRTGEYLIRVEFPPLVPGAGAEWVLVKLTSVPVPAFQMAETYPVYAYSDYYYPFDFGYDYADRYGYYYPWDYRRTSPVWHRTDRDHGRGDHGQGDRHDPPGRFAGDGRHRYGPTPAGNGLPGREHHPRTADYSPRGTDSGRGRENNPTGHGGPATGGHPGGSNYTPPPPPRHDTAPAPAPAARPDTSRDNAARDNKYK